MRPMESFFVEDDQNSDACGNCHIGDIEDRIKERELLSAPDRKPFREHGIFNEWEIKHVDHFSVE